jgi:hypothetical protein
MRKLKQIIKISDPVEGYMEIPPQGAEIMALDENGELWFGKVTTTDDDRRVIDWSPINGPKDGVGFTEPQLNFFDQWERDAHKRISADTSRETIPLANNSEDEAE